MGLKQTVDYDQGFVTTKLGCLGIKVLFTNFAPLEKKKQGQGLKCLKRITEKVNPILWIQIQSPQGPVDFAPKGGK
jgi:hypothetical protein